MSQEQRVLEEHTLQFALAVREFGRVLPLTVSNVEDLRQLVRASGSIGERFITAYGAPSKQEYLSGIRACGVEAKNTWYWLRIIDTQGAGELELQREKLMRAAQELAGVFNQILQNSAR